MTTLTRQGIAIPYVESLTDDPADVWGHIQPVIHATAQTEIWRGDLVTLDAPAMIDSAREHLAAKLGVQPERLVFEGFEEHKEHCRELKGSFRYHPPIQLRTEH